MDPKSFRDDFAIRAARNTGKLFRKLAPQNSNYSAEEISIMICSTLDLMPQPNLLKLVNSIITKFVDDPFDISEEYGLDVELMIRDELRKYGVPFRYLAQCQTIPLLERNDLYDHYGSLDLSGLVELSNEAADTLSKHRGALNLSGLVHLSDIAAESLSNHQRLEQWSNSLDRPYEIFLPDDDLSDHWGDLNLSGLKRISYAAAESLSRYKGLLDLSGLTELSSAIAESFSKHRAILVLSGLTELSDTAAGFFSNHEGALHMSSLRELSDASAKALSKHRGTLNLTGLTKLSDIAAESLSLHWGRLTINANTELSNRSEMFLSRCKLGFHQTKLSDANIVLETKRFSGETMAEHDVRQNIMRREGRTIFKPNTGGVVRG